MRHRRLSAAAPEPQAIDPASGFKVPLSNLRRQWDNQLVDYRFIDKRNPQDFVRGRKDDQALPYARPEPPDSFVPQPIAMESGAAFMTTEAGSDVFQEGTTPESTL